MRLGSGEHLGAARWVGEQGRAARHEQGDRPASDAGEHELQGVALARSRRPGDQEAVAADLGVEALQGEAVAADADGHEAVRDDRRLHLPRLACADGGGQVVDALRAARAGEVGVPVGGLAADLLQHPHLVGARTADVEQPPLHLARPLARPERTTGWHHGRDLAHRDPDVAEVARVAHRQCDPVLDQRADPADEAGAVGGHHHPDADAGALLEQGGDPVQQHATVEGLERLDEALPPVEEYDEIGQPLVGGDTCPLLADVGEAPLGQRLLPAGQLLLQERDQAVHPVGLRPGDDSADVWQCHQRQQRVVARVDAVEVHVLG